MKRFIKANYDRDYVESLMKKAKRNLNSPSGYKAYYELEKYVVDHNLDDDILYDLAADFRWDDDLNDAVNELAIAEGRYDLVAE